MGLPVKQEKQRSKKSMTLEKELESALKKVQSQLIVSSDGYWSLSNVLNIVAAGGIIASKKLDRSEWQKIKAAVEQKKLNFDHRALQDLAKKIA
ncbi:MAG: hypothetical protein QXW38_07120 [Candidatus Nitrosotenuis sp.]